MKLASIEDVYANHLGDLRSTEIQLIEALPKMAEAASNKKLREAFTQHLAETKVHLERLEHVIATSPCAVHNETCAVVGCLAQDIDRIIEGRGRAR